MLNPASNLVESIASCRHFDVDSLRVILQKSYRHSQYRDAFHAELSAGEVWIFDYGVMIFWGAPEDAMQRLISDTAPSVRGEFPQHEVERYQFLMAEMTMMREDTITLASDEILQRLAVSHALAQSSKLGHFEQMAKNVIVENTYLSTVLADTGKIPLSRKSIAKLRGTLFSVKSDIMLNFNLLDTPEFFWSYPELEHEYNLVAKYLDIVSRVTVLNKKLETIHELLEMLASEQHHKHSSILEWIIILLIAFEVVLFFVH